jgi:ubiquinone biosynthesis protein Coq4
MARSARAFVDYEPGMPLKIRQMARTLPTLVADPFDLPAVVKLFDGMASSSLVRLPYQRMAERLDEADRARLERLTREPVDMEALGRLPRDSFGGAYARWMSICRFSPSYYADVYPPSVALFEAHWPLLRYAKVHDFHHVAMGLGANLPDEIGLQVFNLLNFGEPMGGMTLGLLPYVLARYGQPARTLAQVGRCARLSRRLPDLWIFPFEERYAQPLAELRRELGLPVEGLGDFDIPGAGGPPQA